MDLDLNEFIHKAHGNAVNKGFWDKDIDFSSRVMLVVTELAEAVEADRHGDTEGVQEEIADVFIRLADLCGGDERLTDIVKHIREKMEVNKKRPRLHGKEY